MNPIASKKSLPLPFEPLLTTRDVADALGVGRQRVDKLVREGKLQAVLVGARRRFQREEILDYIDRNTTERRDEPQ